MPNVQPNEYVLNGGNISITYQVDGFLQQHRLSYHDGQMTKNFSGSEIRVLPTEIGLLVTVTTFITIDTGATSFSMLLPVIELANMAKTQTFETAAVFTHHRGPNSFPSAGVRESYGFTFMLGTARVVELPLSAIGVQTASRLAQ